MSGFVHSSDPEVAVANGLMRKRWVEMAGMPEQELETLISFARECILAGYGVTFKWPPLASSDYSQLYYGRSGEFLAIASFGTSKAPRYRIDLRYNWKNAVRRWVLRRNTSSSSSCYKSVDTAIKAVSRLLRSYNGCAI